MQNRYFDPSRSDLKNIIETIGAETVEIQKEAKNATGINNILVGDSGVGKTTVALYLSGETIISKRNQEGDFIYERQNQSQSQKYPKAQIGENRIKSQTKSPYLLKYKKQRNTPKFIWDTPGFKDSKGSNQEICNNFYIDTLFENLNNVRFILVTSQEAMKSNHSKDFLQKLDQFIKKFWDLNILDGNIELLITKCDAHQEKKYLLQTLRKPLEIEEKDMNIESTKSDIEQIIKYLEQDIHIFYKPQQENQILKSQSLSSLEDNIDSNQDGIQNIYEQVKSVSVCQDAQMYSKRLFGLCNDLLLEEVEKSVDVLKFKSSYELNDLEGGLSNIVADHYNIDNQVFCQYVIEEREEFYRLFNIEVSRRILDCLNIMSEGDFSFQHFHRNIVECFQIIQPYYCEKSQSELDKFTEEIYAKYTAAKNFKKLFPDKLIDIVGVQRIMKEYRTELLEKTQEQIENLKINTQIDSRKYYENIIELSNFEQVAEFNFDQTKNIIINLQYQSYFHLGNIYEELNQLQTATQKYILCFSKEYEQNIFMDDIIEKLTKIYYKIPEYVQGRFIQNEGNIKIEKLKTKIDQQIIMEIKEFQHEFSEKIKDFSMEFSEEIKKAKFIIDTNNIEQFSNFISLFEIIWEIQNVKDKNSADEGIEQFQKIVSEIQQRMNDKERYPYLDMQIRGLNDIKQRNLWEETKNLNLLQPIIDNFNKELVNLTNIVQNLVKNINYPSEENQNKDFLQKMLSFYLKMPKNKYCLLQRSKIYNNLGKISQSVDETIHLCKKSLKIEKEQPQIIKTLAECLEIKEEYLKAQKCYQIIHYYNKSMECFEKAEKKMNNVIDVKYMRIAKQKCSYLASINQYEQAFLFLEKLKEYCNFDQEKIKEINEVIFRVQIVKSTDINLLKNGLEVAVSKPIYPQTNWDKFNESDQINLSSSIREEEEEEEEVKFEDIFEDQNEN